MFRVAAFVLCLWMIAGHAVAGPWARDTGTYFTSLSVEKQDGGGSYTSLYGEYGLSMRRTLIVELGRASAGETTAMLSYQVALDDPDGAHRVTAFLGAGLVDRDDEITPMGQAGISYGRGFSGPWQGGWFSADTRIIASGDLETLTEQNGAVRVETTYLTSKLVAKSDLTLGLKPTHTVMLINQLRLERRQGERFSARLGVSVVHDLTRSIKLEAGAVTPLLGDSETAVRLGTWFAF